MPSPIEVTTYGGVAIGGAIAGRGFKFWERTTRKTLKYLDQELETLRKDVAGYRHETRNVRMKLEAAMTANRIYVRYIQEAGIDIRAEDQLLIDLAVMPQEPNKLQ